MESKTPTNDWLAMVLQFHSHFDLPIAGTDGRILPETRRVVVAGFLLEKLVGFMGSYDEIRQLDNAIDFLYYCWGIFVELGRVPTSLDDEFPLKSVALGQLEYRHRVSFSQRAAGSVFEFAKSDTMFGQGDFIEDAARIMLRCLRSMGVDPVGLFEIIHDSNMGKLWPAGDYRMGTDGRFAKPGTWESPEKRLAEVVLERQKEFEDDEIPF